MQPSTRPAQFSFVQETPAATPEAAHVHFSSRLEFETDCSDVHTDLSRKARGVVVVDVRVKDAYRGRHVPGAINIPTRSIDAETTAHLSKDDVIVTYCSGPGCNGSTKGAIRFAALGFRVKEMIGGLDYWVREGYPTEGTLGAEESIFPELDRVYP
jgi:rhodanese-related sulfurtransferase